jgi:two-component system response regulator HydG
MREETTLQEGVLLVDDEKNFLHISRVTLNGLGIEPVWTIDDSREVMPFLKQYRPKLILLDLIMPHLTGVELLPMIREDFPQIPVIILTASDEVETAVKCMKSGAHEYLVKPVEESRFIASVKSAIELVELRDEISTLKQHLLSKELKNQDAFSSIVTNNNEMIGLFRYVEAIGNTQHCVLITGETGTGKELFARAVHEVSGLNGDFIAVNLAGLDDNMVSDTLFGHAKGAFTGAEKDRDGLIKKASGGTLFLDEIGNLEKTSQVKLLRLLQERLYYPLGSDIPRPSSARILVATNQDLVSLIQAGDFRKDLYYRLRTHSIHIPPLRNRREDIFLLLNHFLEKASGNLDKKKPTLPPELLTILYNYNFPGNVREMESMIMDAVAQHTSGILSTKSFRKFMSTGRMATPGGEIDAVEPLLSVTGPRLHYTGGIPTIKEVEAYLIEEALKLSNGNQGIAAELLGITRQTLTKRLSRKRKKNQT